MTEERPGRFRPDHQTPPAARPVSDDVVIRFEHVFEVQPRLMSRFDQQPMPVWDTQRIVAARWDHLADIHGEFADDVLLAGEGPDAGP